MTREHVDHLSRVILPSKPGQFFELIDKSRQKLDRIYHELDDTFYPIFVLLKEQFDLDQLIENDSNPKLIKKEGKIVIPSIGLLKKESDQPENQFLTTAIIENQPDCSFQLKDVFLPLNRSRSYSELPHHIRYLIQEYEDAHESSSSPPSYDKAVRTMSKYDKNDILSTLLSCNTCSCVSILTVIFITFIWIYSRLDGLDEILKLIKKTQ